MSGSCRHRGQEQEGDSGRVACLIERRRVARQARAAGFLAAPAQYAAALGAARAFAAATDFSRVSPGKAERVHRCVRELDEEISRTGDSDGWGRR